MIKTVTRLATQLKKNFPVLVDASRTNDLEYCKEKIVELQMYIAQWNRDLCFKNKLRTKNIKNHTKKIVDGTVGKRNFTDFSSNSYCAEQPRTKRQKCEQANNKVEVE